MSNSTLILCGAPYYLPHTLTLYERHRVQGTVQIMALGVRGLYDFLKSCKLPDVDVQFVPTAQTHMRLINPLSMVALRDEINRIYGEYFAGVEGATVFTFGDFNDMLQASIHARLSRHNQVFNMGIFDGNPPQRLAQLSVKQRILWRVSEWAAQAQLQPMRMGNTAGLAFLLFLDDARYGIQRDRLECDPGVLDRYAHHLPKTPPAKKSVLLLESAEGHFYRNYEEVLRKVMKTLNAAGCHVFVKGHPRCGYSTFLNDYPIEVLPSYVPAEFLAVDELDYILGIHSIGLASLYKKRHGRGVASLLDLFLPIDGKQQECFRKLIQEDQTLPVTSFPASVQELSKFLSQP